MPDDLKIEGPLIFDTSALFNFGRRGELEFLLERLSSQVALSTTPAVHEEACQQVLNRAYYAGLLERSFSVIQVNIPADLEESIARLASQLGTGELEVIIMTKSSGGTAVIDDRQARAVAKQLEIRVVGTLGLLAVAIEQNWLGDIQALQFVEKMRSRGFRIPAVPRGQSFYDYLELVQGG